MGVAGKVEVGVRVGKHYHTHTPVLSPNHTNPPTPTSPHTRTRKRTQPHAHTHTYARTDIINVFLGKKYTNKVEIADSPARIVAGRMLNALLPRFL